EIGVAPCVLRLGERVAEPDDRPPCPGVRHGSRVEGARSPDRRERGCGSRRVVRGASGNEEAEEECGAERVGLAAVLKHLHAPEQSPHGDDFHSQESSISRSSPATALLTPRCPWVRNAPTTPATARASRATCAAGMVTTASSTSGTTPT